MVRVTPLDAAKNNFVAGASNAGTTYKDAIMRVSDWQVKAASAAAETLYAAKVQQAITAKRRQAKLAKVSNAAWQQAAADRGAQRIGSGMTANADKWATRWSPFKAALESVTLPDRTADPVANVNNRVIPIVKALVAAKSTGTA